MSASTVSRALRDHPHVRSAIKQKVLEAVEKLGYRPNPLVAALMQQIRTNRTPVFKGNLAYLDWCAKREDFERMEVLQRFYEGARSNAESLGYKLEHFFPMADKMKPSSLMRILEARGMTGAALLIYVQQDFVTRKPLSPLPQSSDVPMDFSNLATAVIGGKFHDRTPHFSQTDQYAAGRMVAEELLSRDYKSPGIIISEYIDVATENRFHSGVHSVWSRHKGNSTSLKTKVVREDDWQPSVDWIRKKKLDAVICYTGNLEVVLRECGIGIPNDLGFISLDANPEGEISGINQMHEEVGSAAINLVVNQLNRGQTGFPEVARGVIVEGSWVEGKTLRPRRTC